LPPRFIIDGADDAYANVALEEAILTHNEGLVVRIWENERSVVIGRSQLARYETNLEQCAAEGIPIVRRITAGGAVYNGPGNLNWSLFTAREYKEGGLGYIWDVHAVFRMGASLVSRAAEGCGVKTWLEEPNRIASAGGKVGGMAAYISSRGLLCHGTLLLDADLDEAQRLTEPSRVELERRYTRSVPARMANTGIGAASFINSLRDAVVQETGGDIETSELTTEESQSLGALIKRYSDPRWNLGDPFEVSAT